MPVTIWTNVPITRRKSFYLIEAGNGEIIFRHRHFWPCIEFLAAEAHEVYEIRPSEPPRGAVVSMLAIDRRP